MDRKPYTAELQRQKASKPNEGGAAQSGFPSYRAAQASETSSPPSNDAVLHMLAEIKIELRQLNAKMPASAAEPPRVIVTPDSEPGEGQSEINVLRTEVRALAVCIEQTKAEIAALNASGSNDDHLKVVGQELDAIVDATEGATQSILEAAEKLDSLNQQLQMHCSEDSFMQGISGEIGDTVISIYEACNFQDITGQRISKVVKALKYVEERIMAMIGIWGEDAIAEIQPQGQGTKGNDHEEAHLLNGPQLAQHAISQDDIDKLFG